MDKVRDNLTTCQEREQLSAAQAVVLGPSRSSDPSRVCVRFEDPDEAHGFPSFVWIQQERRDGGTMWVNVLPALAPKS